MTELKRHDRWASVFFTLKDPEDGSCVGVTMARGRFDALRLDLENGERVHVFGRPELYEQRGEFKLRALTIERFGLGAHLAALERLKAKLAAEGLFAAERKRALPFLPRRIGVVTGNDAAAKRDVVTTIQLAVPAGVASLVAETYVQGPRAAGGDRRRDRRASARQPDVDVIVLTRGGGSFEDLLPFSDERVVRAVAACPVPVVSAVGHEQDTPLCDLAADVRASTPDRRPASSSSPSSLSCPASSTARARRSREASAARSSGTAQRLERTGRAAARRSARRSRARRPAARAHARTPAQRPDAHGRAEAGGAREHAPPSSLRCHLCKHSGEGTRSSGRSPRASSTSSRRRLPAGAVDVTRRRGRVRRTRRGGHAVSEQAEPTFEQAQAELEQIVERLERGQAPLDEAIAALGARRAALRVLPREARRRRGQGRGARAPRRAVAAPCPGREITSPKRRA